MKRPVMLFLVVVLIIGGLLFYREILGAFQGMTVVESLKFIVTFVIHVAVGTACAYALYTLPEIVGPGLKLLKQSLRRKRRQLRRGRFQLTQDKTARITSPKVDATRLLTAMLMKQLPAPKDSQPTANADDSENQIHFDF